MFAQEPDGGIWLGRSAQSGEKPVIRVQHKLNGPVAFESYPEVLGGQVGVARPLHLVANDRDPPEAMGEIPYANPLGVRNLNANLLDVCLPHLFRIEEIGQLSQAGVMWELHQRIKGDGVCR